MFKCGFLDGCMDDLIRYVHYESFLLTSHAKVYVACTLTNISTCKTSHVYELCKKNCEPSHMVEPLKLKCKRLHFIKTTRGV